MDSRGARQRLVRAWPTRRDRGDGRAAGGADPARPAARAPIEDPTTARRRASSRSRRSTRSGSSTRTVAAERGYVDDVIAAADTRRVLVRRARARSRPSASTSRARRHSQHTALSPRTAHAARRTSASSSPACSTTRRSRSPSRGVAQEQGAEVVLTLVRPGDEPHRSAPPGGCPTPSRDRRARRDRRRTTSTRSPATSAASSTASSTRSVRARVVPRRRLPRRARGTTSRSRCRSRPTR